MRHSFIVMAASAITGCDKPALTPEPNSTFTIKGQLLESRGNPVPVSGYSLTLGQMTSIGPLGLIGDIDSVKKTDDAGRFIFRYKDYNQYAVFMANQEFNGDFGELSLNGWDEAKQNNTPALWLPFKCLKNYDLETIYLFKNIQVLVRKVFFNTPLYANDSLELITSNTFGAEYKTIYGPVSAGSQFTDTLRNIRISVFNLTNNNYTLRSALKKTGYQTNSDIVVGVNDEDYREILMPY